MRTVAVLLALAAALPGAELRWSGVIGQSQPAGDPPCPGMASGPVAGDGVGRTWTAIGDRLHLVDPATGSLRPLLGLPAAASGLGWTGERLVAVLADRRLAVVDPAAAVVERVLALPADTVRTHLPAAPAPLLALAGRVVTAVPLDGTPPRALFTVPDLGAGAIEAIGLLPGGDVVVGTGYPGMQQVRFAADGRRIQRPGWPRPGWPRQYLGLGGRTWMLGHDGAVTLVDGPAEGPGRPLAPAAERTPCSGLAPAGDGWWMAGSQGLLEIAGDGRTRRRLGGAPDLRGLHLGPDGRLLALAEDGQRVVRWPLDGGPDTAPDSPGNEPWRMANGWTAKATAMAGDGDGALLLEAAAGRVWRFEPHRTRWADRPWTPACPEGTLAAPTALATGDVLVRVLDGGLLEADRRTTPLAWRPVALPPGITATILAADGDRRLLLAEGGRITALEADPAWQVRWSVDLGAPVTALALLPEAALAATGGTIHVLDRTRGAPAAPPLVLPGAGITALAASAPWVLAADRTGRRIIRLRWRGE